LTAEGWKAIDPAATADEVPGLRVGRLAVADRVLTLAAAPVPALVGGPRDDGGTGVRLSAVSLTSIIDWAADPETPLYNLRVDGDHTYVADDWLVHNKLEP
jgi:hypothetical protein